MSFSDKTVLLKYKEIISLQHRNLDRKVWARGVTQYLRYGLEHMENNLVLNCGACLAIDSDIRLTYFIHNCLVQIHSN
jgi:hypothetical protein